MAKNKQEEQATVKKSVDNPVFVETVSSKTIKLGKNIYVPYDNVSLFTSYDSEPIRRKVREMKAEGKILDMCSGRKILSTVFLKDGTAVLLSTTIETLNDRITQN